MWPRSTQRTERQLTDGWTLRQVDPPSNPYSDTGAPMSAVVPGHVHLDLQRAGVRRSRVRVVSAVV